MKSFVVCLFTLLISHWGWSYDPTQDLLNAFGGSCVRELTRGAITQSQGLTHILEALEKDENCQSVAAQTRTLINNLNQTQVYPEQASDFERGLIQDTFLYNQFSEQVDLERVRLFSEFEAEYRQYNAGATNEEVYEAWSISGRQSSTYLSLMESTQAGQADLLLRKQVKVPYFKYDERKQRIERVRQFQFDVNNLFSALSSATKCTQEKKYLITQIASQILATSSNFASGVTGNALLATGVAVAGISELIRGMTYREDLSHLKNSRLDVALGCAIEGMAKTYCEANDTQKLIMFNVNVENESEPCEACREVIDVITLIDSKLPLLTSWVDLVVAGSEAGSISQASEKEKVIKLRESLTLNQNSFNGLINSSRKTHDSVPVDNNPSNIQLRKNLRVSLIQQLSTVISENAGSGGTSSSPYGPIDVVEGVFNNFFSKDTSCGPLVWIYSKATSREAIGRDQTMSCIEYIRTTYPDTFNTPPSYPEIEQTIDILLAETRDYVNLKVQQVYEVNPYSVLAKLKKKQGVQFDSPYDFFVEGKDYLEKLIVRLDPLLEYDLLVLANNTLCRINQSLKVVRNRPEEVYEECGRDDGRIYSLNQKLEVEEQISKLAEYLAPLQETLFIRNAFVEIVSQDLTKKLERREIPDQSLVRIMRDFTGGPINLILRQYVDIDSAYDDASKAKRVIKQTMSTFTDHFKSRLRKNIRTLRKQYDRTPQDKGLKRLLGLNCLLIQTLPVSVDSRYSFQTMDSSHYCQDALYESLVSYRDLDPIKYNDLKQLPFEKRVCTLYEFRRKMRILEHSKL